MTTPSRCEPPEEWREVEGWHFLKSWGDKLIPYEWIPRLGGYWSKLDTSSVSAHDLGFTYHAPALPDAPAEIERLRSLLEQIVTIADGAPEPDPHFPDPDAVRDINLAVNKIWEVARAAVAQERAE